MAKLDSEKRQSINERMALHTSLRKSFEECRYFNQCCNLCNWASNGLTAGEAIAENRKHEATHPETAQIKATMLSFQEIRDSLHDHDCKMAICACKCGCQNGPFCTTVAGPLCASCMIAEGRGHDEHGEKV